MTARRSGSGGEELMQPCVRRRFSKLCVRFIVALFCHYDIDLYEGCERLDLSLLGTFLQTAGL